MLYKLAAACFLLQMLKNPGALWLSLPQPLPKLPRSLHTTAALCLSAPNTSHRPLKNRRSKERRFCYSSVSGEYIYSYNLYSAPQSALYRQWRMQRGISTAAVREREIAKPKRERRAAKGQAYALMPLIKKHS